MNPFFRNLSGTLLLAIGGDVVAATLEIEVNGLVCGFCAQGIDRTLSRLPEVEDVFVSLEHRLVAVVLKPDRDLADADVTRAITDSGYATVRIERTEASIEAIRARVAGAARDD